jgi:DNA-binding NarL/FixJ family response regulator
MSAEKVFKIAITDSQFLIVEALQSLIQTEPNYSIIGVASTHHELQKILQEKSPDLLIVDPANIDFDGLDDLKNIKIKYTQLGILILTNLVTKQEFADISRIGIKNISYKTADRDEIFAAIDATLKNKKFYSDEVLDLFLDLGEAKNSGEETKTLTPSEIEIVKLIAEGLTTKEIASKRNISYHTVNTHRKNIFRKMEVSNASELIMLAIKAGWINNIEYYI